MLGRGREYGVLGVPMAGFPVGIPQDYNCLFLLDCKIFQSKTSISLIFESTVIRAY
jgi:hypothetical protein